MKKKHGKISFKIQLFVAITIIFFIFFLPYIALSMEKNDTLRGSNKKIHTDIDNILSSINKPIKFHIIADLDKQSAEREDRKTQFYSILKTGEIRKKNNYNGKLGEWEVIWIREDTVHGAINEAGRGMELSELVDWNGKLLTMDDRTGIIYEIDHTGLMMPRHIVSEGDGQTSKGAKLEWGTIRDDHLYVGSIGKEYTNNEGKIVSFGNLWVAKISTMGEIIREDWTPKYNRLRQAIGGDYVYPKGYILHEAVTWSEYWKRWFALPRRVSDEPYDEVKDESKGSNVILIADDDFRDIDVRRIGSVTPTRGFSSFKFVPGTNDQLILAIKSEELSHNDHQSAFLTLFTVDGDVLMDEIEIPGNRKYEGLEFDMFEHWYKED